jgi:hypothetical protein
VDKFVPGTIVQITKLKKASWYLYKKYLPESELLICPCHVKRGTLLVVIDHFDNNVLLLQVKNNSRLTMTYSSDVEAVYEPTLNSGQ